MPTHIKGTLIAILGVLVISPDTLLVRLIDIDPWTMIFWRGMGQGLVLFTALACVSPNDVWRRTQEIGKTGLGVAFLLAISSLLFIGSLHYTSVANTLVLISTAPLFGALQSRFFLKEQLPQRTWFAVIAGLACVVLIVGSGFGGGTLLGDAMALIHAVTLSASFVLIRSRKEIDMIPALGLSGILNACMALPFVAVFAVSAQSFPYLAVLCGVVLPVSLGLLTTAPRFIPAPEVNMIMLLEMILGPLFVWAVIGEAIPMLTAVGGGLLCVTLLIHAILTLKAERPASAPAGGVALGAVGEQPAPQTDTPAKR